MSSDVYELIAEMRESDNLADRIVVAIWNDVTDRRGWRQEHDQFAPDIQIEIVETWRAMVRRICRSKPMSTDIEAMAALATRLEQAGPESQAGLLNEAFFAIFGNELDKAHRGEWEAWLDQRARFTAMLDCGAYLSAAEMLVPNDGFWRVGHDGEGPDPAMFRGDVLCAPGSGHHIARASTSALALATACVRAAIAGKES